MGSKRLIQRGQKPANRSLRRYCSSCGDPLGSTEGKCFDCGGSSRRGGSGFFGMFASLLRGGR